MNKKIICLIGLFLTANSFAQVNNPNKNTAAQAKPTKKSFSVAPFKIPVGKGDKQEEIPLRELQKKTQVVDKVPDFVKQQQEKINSNPSVANNKAKVFPPNITNFTAADIKNDPTLQKGKVFYIKEEVKPALSVVEEYNQRRQMFLKKSENARNIQMQRREQLLQAQKEAYERSRAKDEYRRQMGIPITRFENTAGPDGRQAGVTREAMGAMSNGTPLPKVPQTGKVQ